MPNLQPISRERYACRHWLRNPNLKFACFDTVSRLTLQEMPLAAMHMPIGFLAVESSFVPVVLQGLKVGTNLFVTPDGRWLSGYVPVTYRTYPFSLARGEQGQMILCFDEDSGLLSDAEGEAFFGDDGAPTKLVSDLMEVLSKNEAGRLATERACAKLQQHGLIQPWPIKLRNGDAEQAVEGVFRIDEAAFNALGAEALLDLRNASAMAMIYCQLLSMQHLQRLGQLAQAHAQAQVQMTSPLPVPTKGRDLDLSFLEGGDTLKFV